MTFIAVIIGAETSKIRFAEATKMFNYGFANYALKNVVSTQLPLARIDVVGSNQKNVELYASKEFNVLEKKGEEKTYTTKLMAPSKIKAPQKAGSIMGKLLVLNQNNIVVAEIGLNIASDITKIKLKEAITNIINNW